jgi:hypothetical protein
MVDMDHNRRRARAATAGRSITTVEPIARSLHAFGPRLLGELLLELCGDDADKWARVKRYTDMSRDLVSFFGGEKFPPRPGLRAVGGRDYE